jgi:hypothetical protein
LFLGRNFPRTYIPVTEWLASLASASPESCQEAVADFSLLEAYTERLEDAEAGSAEVSFFYLNFLFLILSYILVVVVVV